MSAPALRRDGAVIDRQSVPPTSSSISPLRDSTPLHEPRWGGESDGHASAPAFIPARRSIGLERQTKDAYLSRAEGVTVGMQRANDPPFGETTIRKTLMVLALTLAGKPALADKDADRIADAPKATGLMPGHPRRK